MSLRRGSDDNAHYTDQGAILTADTENFIIGQKVFVGGIRSGSIAYIGETHFAPGEWAGIVLDEPNGKNDGCVAGKRYFQCEPKKGIFSRLTRLTIEPLAIKEGSPSLRQTPDRSRTVSPTASIRSSYMNMRSPGKSGMAVGDRVIVSSGFGSRPGLLKYIGDTGFAPGTWCGIELDEASGKNDGSVDGIRYFECAPKFGVFVPVAKVSLSPSSKKNRLSRAGSKESLASNMTMNSIATTNTSRLRLSGAQKKPIAPKPISPQKSSYSMQDVIREKSNHIEQLMMERDLDREDSQLQALQFQKTISELQDKISKLKKQLGDEKKRTDDLQNSVDEAKFCEDELDAQTQVYKEQISELEQKLISSISNVDGGNSIDLIKDNYDSKITRLRENEKSFQESIKNLLSQNENYQRQILTKDEAIERLEEKVQSLQSVQKELIVRNATHDNENAHSSEVLHDELSKKTEEIQELTKRLGEMEDYRTELAKLKATLKENEAKSNEEKTEQLSAQEKKELEIVEMKEEITQLSSELTSYQTKINSLEEELTKTKQFNEEIEKSAEDLKIQHDLEKEKSTSLETKVTNLENVLGKLSSDQESSGVESEKLNLEINNLRKEIQEQSTEVQVKVAEIEKLKTELAASQTDSSSTRENSKKVQNELLAQKEELDKSLEGKVKELGEALNEIKSLTNIVEEGKRSYESLKSSLEGSSQETVRQFEEKLVQLQEAKGVTEQELKKKLEELHQVNLEFSKVKDEHLEDTKRIDELQKTLEENQKELEKVSEKSSELEGNVGNQSSEIEKLKSILAEKDNLTASQSNEITDITKKLHNSTEQAQILSSEAKELKEKLEKTNIHVKEKEEDFSKKILEFDELTRKFQALNTKCESLSEQNSSIQKDLENSRSSSSDSNAEVSKLSADIAAKQAAYQELLDKSTAEHITLQTQIQENQQKNNSLLSEIADLKVNHAQGLEKAVALNEKAMKDLKDQFEGDKKHLQENIQKLEDFKLTAEETVKTLEGQLKNVNKDLESTTKSLAEKEKEWISKEEGLFNDLKGKGDSEVAYQSKVVSLTDEISNLKQKLSENMEIIKTKEKELTTVSSEKHNLERVLEKTQQDGVNSITQIEMEKSSFINNIQELNEEIVKKTSQTEELQISVNTLQLDVQNKDQKIVEFEEKFKLFEEKSNQEGAASNKKYDDLESHMKMVELANFELAAKVTKLSEDLQRTEIEKDDVESNLELFQLEADTANKELTEKYENLLKECESLKLTGVEGSKATQDLIEKNSSYVKECEDLKDQVSKKDTSIAELSAQINTLSTEVASLKTEGTQVAQNLTEKSSTFAKECEELKDLISKKDISLADMSSKIEALTSEVSMLKEKSNEKITETTNKLHEVEKEKENIFKEMSELKGSLEKTESKMSALKEDNEVMKQIMQNEDEVQDQLQKYQSMAEEHSRCDHLIKELQQSVQNSGGAVKKVERELVETKLKLQSLEQLQKNNNEYSKADESSGDVNSVDEIRFLNSIIADMQQKNDTLKAQVEILEQDPIDFTKKNVFDTIIKRKPAPRKFCDICDEFDLHETEDCPKQSSDSPVPFEQLGQPGEKKERKIPEPRKYCECCEVFGHEAGECPDDEFF